MMQLKKSKRNTKSHKSCYTCACKPVCLYIKSMVQAMRQIINIQIGSHEQQEIVDLYALVGSKCKHYFRKS